jgi:DNA ligase (NAD+)
LKLSREQELSILHNIVIDNRSKNILEFYCSKLTNKIEGENIFGNEDTSLNELSKIYKAFNDGQRSSYNFMVDGLVLEIMNQTIRDRLGKNDSTPNYAIALKFDYLQKETTVVGCEFYIGKTMRITPVLKVAPITFYGAVQQHISLSNYKRFTDLNLGIGDKVIIEYRNDVISYVARKTLEQNTPRFKFIDKCPICGHDLFINPTGNWVFCENENCQGKQIGRIEKYVISMNLKGIAYYTIEKLYNLHYISNIVDLYNLTDEDYLKLGSEEGFGEKAALNIKNIINDNKARYEYELLGSLSIPAIGKRKAKELLLSLGTLSNLINLRTNLDETEFIQEIQKIEGFSDILAKNLYNDCDYTLLKNLMGILKLTVFNTEATDEKLSFVITGDLHIPREEAIHLIEKKGWRYLSAISKKVDFLVTNNMDLTTVKSKKAVALNIPIIGEKEFLEKFK